MTRRTIYSWMASGKVETIRTAVGSVRIFVDTLWRTPDDPASSSRDRRGVDATPPDRLVELTVYGFLRGLVVWRDLIGCTAR